MKTILVLVIGFGLGVHFSSYSSVRLVKNGIETAIATADKALR